MIAGFLPILRAEALQELVELSSPSREGGQQLVAQTFPIRHRALGALGTECRDGLPLPHPREGRPCWWRRVALHPSGDRARVEFRPHGQMAHDVAHFPGCTGTGVVPRICGEGVEVLRELRCCCLAKLDTVLACVHGMLLYVFVSPSRKRHGDFCPRASLTPAVSRASSRSEARAKAVGVGSSAWLGGARVSRATLPPGPMAPGT